MDPILGGALATSAGGIWANLQNLAESKRGRQFAERMSGSAYQRAVVDMRLAGINPMLAYMQGGASTPGAPTATVDDALGPAVASAQHGRRLKGEVQLMDAQVGKIYGENALIQEQIKNAIEERKRIQADTSAISVNTQLRGLEMPGALAASRAASGRFGTFTEYLRRLTSSIGGLGTAVGGAAAGAAIGRFGRGAAGAFAPGRGQDLDRFYQR